jgi:hypothetical protein
MSSDDDPELAMKREGVVAARTRSRTLGPASRPVAVPEDMDSGPKAAGVVSLPLNVAWSGSPRRYDLDVRSDRARVYEQVLREGTERDVAFFVEVDWLIELWDELVLPEPVREAWAGWLQRHRNVDLSC